MSTLHRLQSQAMHIRQLIEESKEDPILQPQLASLLEEVEHEIDSYGRGPNELFGRIPIELPRAAIFLSGDAVNNSDGIRPSLAGESLINYEKMFMEQALHDERIAAKTAGRQRRPRGAPIPGLYFTGTLQGSFGLEFVPRLTDDNLDLHTRSLKNVADAIARVCRSESIENTGIPPRVLRFLKRFLNSLSQHAASLRLAFSDADSISLSEGEIKAASARLEREIEEEVIAVDGVFQGLTFETYAFDFVTSDNRVISGTVSDDTTEQELDRILALTHKACVATLLRTTIHHIDGSSASEFTLMNAVGVDAMASTPHGGQTRRLQSPIE